MINDDVLIYDLETSGLDIETAQLKFFGAYSYKHKEYYIYDYTHPELIQHLIKDHKILVGFNNKAFDWPIILRYFDIKDVKYKIHIDLFEVCAPKPKALFGKNKLAQMYPNLRLKKFSLKEIMEYVIKTQKLKLELKKGDIDYEIFKSNTWTPEQLKEIEDYLRADIELTKALFEFFDTQYAPIGELLPEKNYMNYMHITASSASLAYQVICNLTGMDVEWEQGEDDLKNRFAGGHHIEARKSIVKGRIASVDIASAYPHSIIMGNLLSPDKSDNSWKGNNYFKLQGTYNSEKQGKVETELKKLMELRLKAKSEGDKVKANAYKIVINSFYGAVSKPLFKNLYNINAAADCTSIVRTILKKLAKKLDLNGFIPLYGFTDSVMVLIPEGSDTDDLMEVVRSFVEEVKKQFPFATDTFKIELEKELKFIWFVTKNCYLWIDSKDRLDYRATLLNMNRPKGVKMLFDNYIDPKIRKELNINFTEDELNKEMKKLIKDDLSLAAEDYDIKPLDSYKSKTSIQYQICQMYGPGRHRLIPNRKGIGVGKNKGINNPLGYCTIEDFIKHKLTINDIDMTKLMKDFKRFVIIKDSQQTI